jgi:hypothetical protein
MQFLFVTPISRPSFDGGTSVTGIRINSAYLDPDALTCTVICSAIEDNSSGPLIHKVVVPFTGATTMTQLLAAFKTQVASSLGVTFQ